tara:strand:+ start:4322 stop:5107 length:786 start_codon:yes stop_codon:yes gene_type:complete
MIHVYYRLSNPGKEAGQSKLKISNWDKLKSLRNCVDVFGAENITIIGDRLSKKFKKQIQDMKVRCASNDIENAPKLNLKIVDVDNGNGCDTYHDARKLAMEERDDEDIVYLLEDDFLHKPECPQLIYEAINTWGDNAYVSLYDHPDKYLDANLGGNPRIQMGGEVTRLMKSASVHWKVTNSTVMSFACKVKVLKEDDTFHHTWNQGNITDSYGMFTALASTGKGVLTSVPGYSTHVEQAWVSPFTDWTDESQYFYTKTPKL